MYGITPLPPPPGRLPKLFNSGLHDHANPESFETAHFFSRFGWDLTTGMVIKIALCLELFRFLQFVVKQDKTSLCSSLSQLHCSRPPWLVCAPDQNRHAACRPQVHPLLSQFVALGETLLRTLTKAWKYAGTGEYNFSWVQYFAAHFVVRLSNFYTMARDYGSKALGVVESTQ